MQHDAAVPQTICIGIVVKGARSVRIAVTAAASQQEWRPGLEVEDRTDRPTADNLIHHAILVRERLALAKWKIVGTVHVQRVTNVEERRPITQPHVAQE